MSKSLKKVKEKLAYVPLMNNMITCYNSSKKYKRLYQSDFNLSRFMLRHVSESYTVFRHGDVETQIAQLLKRIKIEPVKGNMFFYSIDCYKTLMSRNRKFDNYTVD